MVQYLNLVYAELKKRRNNGNMSEVVVVVHDRSWLKKYMVRYDVFVLCDLSLFNCVKHILILIQGMGKLSLKTKIFNC